MNFFIGNSIEEIIGIEENALIDDDMSTYLYSIEESIPYKAFFSIDPYDDTLLEKEDIDDIILMCEYMLKDDLLNNYDESDELISAIKELKYICCKAIKQCEKIVVIGD